MHYLDWILFIFLWLIFRFFRNDSLMSTILLLHMELENFKLPFQGHYQFNFIHRY